MQKRDVLCVLAFVLGGLLSFGDGAMLGIPVVLATAYLFASARTTAPKRLTAAVAALAR